MTVKLLSLNYKFENRIYSSAVKLDLIVVSMQGIWFFPQTCHVTSCMGSGNAKFIWKLHTCMELKGFTALWVTYFCFQFPVLNLMEKNLQIFSFVPCSNIQYASYLFVTLNHYLVGMAFITPSYYGEFCSAYRRLF